MSKSKKLLVGKRGLNVHDERNVIDAINNETVPVLNLLGMGYSSPKELFRLARMHKWALQDEFIKREMEKNTDLPEELRKDEAKAFWNKRVRYINWSVFYVNEIIHEACHLENGFVILDEKKAEELNNIYLEGEQLEKYEEWKDITERMESFLNGHVDYYTVRRYFGTLDPSGKFILDLRTFTDGFPKEFFK